MTTTIGSLTKTLALYRKHLLAHDKLPERNKKGSEKPRGFSHTQLALAEGSKGGTVSHLCARAGPSSLQVLSLSQLLAPKVSVARRWPNFSEGPSWAGTKRLLWGSVLQGTKEGGRIVRILESFHYLL